MQGRFIETDSGHLYLSCFGTLGGRDVWLYLPPFAEEMNLSRAIVSRQARAFANRGEAVVCLDYFGTGDSEGEFGQACAQTWLRDIHQTIDWLYKQGVASISLWGLRLGGLLALQTLSIQPDASIRRLLLWKPVLDGKLLLNQFFRLKQISDSINGGPKINWMQRVSEKGETIEVAGYPVSPAMLASLNALQLAQVGCTELPSTIWLEPASDKISPAIDKVLPRWAGSEIRLEPVTAPAFWTNPDCYQAPELIERTLQLTRGEPRGE